MRPAHPRRMDLVRPAQVAGYFYPGEKAALKEEVKALLAGARFRVLASSLRATGSGW